MLMDISIVFPRYLQYTDVMKEHNHFNQIWCTSLHTLYCILIQNAIQIHHSNNSQTTIRPFVIYRWESDNNSSKFGSFVLILEITKLNLFTFSTFLPVYQKRLISWIKTKYGPNKINKKFYFSDGAAAEYKNKIFVLINYIILKNLIYKQNVTFLLHPI